MRHRRSRTGGACTRSSPQQMSIRIGRAPRSADYETTPLTAQGGDSSWNLPLGTPSHMPMHDDTYSAPQRQSTGAPHGGIKFSLANVLMVDRGRDVQAAVSRRALFRPSGDRGSDASMAAAATAAASVAAVSDTAEHKREIQRLSSALHATQSEQQQLVHEARRAGESERQLMCQLDAAQRGSNKLSCDLRLVRGEAEQYSCQAAESQRALTCAMEQMKSMTAEQARMQRAASNKEAMQKQELEAMQAQVDAAAKTHTQSLDANKLLQEQLSIAVGQIEKLGADAESASAESERVSSAAAQTRREAIVLSAKARASMQQSERLLVEPAAARAVSVSVPASTAPALTEPTVRAFSCARAHTGKCDAKKASGSPRMSLPAHELQPLKAGVAALPGKSAAPHQSAVDAALADIQAAIAAARQS